MYTISKFLLVTCLVGDYFLLRDIRPYIIIFINMRVVITVTMEMLLRDFGPHGITFLMCKLL